MESLYHNCKHYIQQCTNIKYNEFIINFVTKSNFGAPPVANGAPDPNLFAPLMVGDWVTWSGINVGGGLWSVYSLEANLGIFTAAGKAPVYITIDVAQWGIVGSTRGEVAETRVCFTIFSREIIPIS